MIPPEQVENIKEQIISQIESTFPEEKKAESIEKLKGMDSEQLQEFLIQNNLIKTDGEGSAPGKCIFCSIVSGEVPTNKIDENKEAIAVLEINPISNGHSLILPKEHIPDSSKIPKQATELAEKVAKKIKSKLKPKDVTISSSNLFGHEIINILPVYEKETMQSERQQTKPEELEELKKLLEVKTKITTIKKTVLKKLKAEKLWLPKRIP